MAKKNQLPQSTLSRTTSLLGAGLKILGKEAGQRIKETFKEKWDESAPEIIKLRVEQAKILGQNLSQLKGAAMKLGQIISLDAADFLPKEAADILAQLQSDAEPVDFSIMKNLLLEELGAERLALLNLKSETPIAAASIGQVYRGECQIEMQTRPVAVKVQYPGVAEAIDSDILILKNALQPFLRLTKRDIDLTEMFAEMKLMLEQESNYVIEAAFMKEYRSQITDHKDYAVPEVINEFSTRRVICMEWMTGTPVKVWINKNPSYEKRLRMAHLVLDLYLLEFYKWGLVQTDPNFGNFLIDEKSDQLILLDFGSCKKYDRTYVEQYKKFITVFSQNDSRKTIQEAIDFKLIDPRESDQAKNYFIQMMEVAMEPFNHPSGLFDFQDPSYNQRNRKAILQFTSHLKYSPPPRHLIFLHRKLGGIFNFAKMLGVKMDLKPYWQKMQSL